MFVIVTYSGSLLYYFWSKDFKQALNLYKSHSFWDIFGITRSAVSRRGFQEFQSTALAVDADVVTCGMNPLFKAIFRL